MKSDKVMAMNIVMVIALANLPVQICQGMEAISSTVQTFREGPRGLPTGGPRARGRLSVEDVIKNEVHERRAESKRIISDMTSLLADLISAITTRVEIQNVRDDVDQSLRHGGEYKGVRIASREEYEKVHKLTKYMEQESRRTEIKKATNLMRFLTRKNRIPEFWINPLETFLNGTTRLK